MGTATWPSRGTRIGSVTRNSSKADVYTDAKAPLELTIEIRDRQTTDYWTRVNYTTVVPPGASTLVLPTAAAIGESRANTGHSRCNWTDQVNGPRP